MNRIARKLVRQADGQYAWSVAVGRRLIASGIADNLDMALVAVEAATRAALPVGAAGSERA